MTLDDLIRDFPSLHRVDGVPVFWGISGASMQRIHDLITPESRTVETGAGFSTLGFALKGCRHTAICPDPELFDNIRGFCREHDLPVDQLDCVVSPSQDWLPRFEETIDLAFIDGDHAFPLPMIDYYYLARRLRVGGVMVVDDTHLWTGEVLAQHMASDSDWAFMEELDGRTAFFRRVAPWRDKGFGAQPFVVLNSRGLRGGDWMAPFKL
jgi:hypothetical protein